MAPRKRPVARRYSFTFRVDPAEMEWYRDVARLRQTSVAELLRSTLATEAIRAGLPVPDSVLQLQQQQQQPQQLQPIA